MPAAGGSPSGIDRAEGGLAGPDSQEGWALRFPR